MLTLKNIWPGNKDDVLELCECVGVDVSVCVGNISPNSRFIISFCLPALCDILNGVVSDRVNGDAEKKNSQRSAIYFAISLSKLKKKTKRYQKFHSN